MILQILIGVAVVNGIYRYRQSGKAARAEAEVAKRIVPRDWKPRAEYTSINDTLAEINERPRIRAFDIVGGRTWRMS